ncbi:Enterobactin exporter EntS [Usitatibacter rugosus]|uniref:Enterobactin exporter EntS n=1 Tax=Usitatibacter rugosus TaxID=2732067 RepID=A0A6M4GUD1_9PROT|nr:MFS transporter [Usitatibacter rugosus]QJR10746.1 Enterobactin exporter EntS [Usitatibacter rugosus]
MASLIKSLHPRLWFTGLWLSSDFRKLWGSLTITHFGGQITFLALPLTAALLLDASPFEVGVLTALEALPFPLFGLFAGVIVDRTPKLPVIIASDVGRGLALLAVPLCAWFGVLSMPVLYTVGFLVGTGTVLGWPAYQVFMTERVGRENLVEANAKIGVADSAAQLVGPGLAGILIQWLTAPFAILLDAFSFFFSAWMLRGIPPRESDAPKVKRSSVKEEILEGLRTIWHNRTLRALVWVLGTWQVFRHAFIAIVVLFCARELNFSAGHVGALFMLAGIGSLAAATLTARLNARFGMGPTMLTGITGTGVAWLVMGAAMGPYWLASAVFGLGMFLLDLTAMVFFINYLTLRQAVTPDRLLGRVTATMICLTVSTAPLGGIAGGWVADHYGLRSAMIAAGVGALLLGVLATWLSPLAKMHELPGPPQEPAVTESVAEEMAGD